MTQQLVYIYADESCLGNQYREQERRGAAAGLIEQFVPTGRWHRKDFAHFDPDTTNNRMALQSALVGLGSLQRPSDVVFTSDSQYLIRGMREWIHGWVRRGWRRKGGRVENEDLWRLLLPVAREHRVEWRWVKGHAQHPKNEYANDLAVETAETGEAPSGLTESGFAAWLGMQQTKGRYREYADLPPEARFRPSPLPGD